MVSVFLLRPCWSQRLTALADSSHLWGLKWQDHTAVEASLLSPVYRSTRAVNVHPETLDSNHSLRAFVLSIVRALVTAALCNRLVAPLATALI